MKKMIRMLLMMSFLCVIAFALPLTAQAEEPVYDLEFSNVVLSKDNLVLDNIVNDSFEITFDITNNGTSEYDYIMCAYYSPEGQFLGQEWIFSFAKNGETDASVLFEIDNSEGNIGYIKIFAFPSFGNMTPITKCIELYTAEGEHPVMWLGEQEATAEGLKIYVLGDEYHGWYTLDEGIDSDLIRETGIKNITVENGIIISMAEETIATDIVELSAFTETGFTDINGIEYFYSPEGCDIFKVNSGEDKISSAAEDLRDSDTVLIAQKDGYLTDVYIYSCHVRELEGYIEVLSSEAVINETVQSANITVRHLTSGEIRSYNLAARHDSNNNDVYSRLTFEKSKEVFVELEPGEIFPAGSVLGYYMRGDEMVLGPVEEHGGKVTLFVENCTVVCDGTTVWELGGNSLKNNSKTKVYLIDDSGEVTSYTGYKYINFTVNNADKVFVVCEDVLPLVKEFFIFGGEVTLFSEEKPKPDFPEPNKDNVIYYDKEYEETADGIKIIYYHHGETKSALLAEDITAYKYSGAYAVRFDENGRIEEMNLEGAARTVTLVKEASFVVDDFSSFIIYTLAEDAEIYDVTDGIKPGEIEVGDFVCPVVDNEGYVIFAFIELKHTPSEDSPEVSRPEPVTGDVLYYPGVSEETGTGTEITYYLNGEEKQSLVAEGLELPEAGAYTFTLEEDVITSMTAVGIRGDIDALHTKLFVKIDGQRFNFSDEMVIYDVSDGVSKVEKFMILDEIIVITNMDDEASIIFIVKPYVQEPTPDPEPEEPKAETNGVIYYAGTHEDTGEGMEIEYYADGTSRVVRLADNVEVPADAGAYKAAFDRNGNIISLEKIGEYGIVTTVKTDYFKTNNNTYVLADEVETYNVTDAIESDKIDKEDEVIVIVDDEGLAYLIFIVG